MNPTTKTALLALLCVVAAATSVSASQQRVVGRLMFVEGQGYDHVDISQCMLQETDKYGSEFVLDIDEDDCISGHEGTFDLEATNELTVTGHPIFHATVVSMSKTEAAPKIAATGSLTVLFVRMNYLDQNETSCDETCLMDNMWDATLNVNGMYNEASYGDVSFDREGSDIITVLNPMNVPSPDSLTRMESDAKSLAAAAGYAFGDYDLLSIYTPELQGIGVAYLPGFVSYMKSAFPDTLAHEFGHNFGVHHANFDPADNAPISSDSETNSFQYGDVGCVMGFSHETMRPFNAIHRRDIGWLSTADDTTEHTLLDCGVTTYDLAALYYSPQEASDNSYGHLAVRADRDAYGEYWFSYRSPIGYETEVTSSFRGVNVHYDFDGNAKSRFVKTLQSTGDTFTDEAGRFTVTLMSMNDNTAVISIEPVNANTFECEDGTIVCSPEDCPDRDMCEDKEEEGYEWLINTWGQYDVEHIDCAWVKENGYCTDPWCRQPAEQYCAATCGFCCEVNGQVQENDDQALQQLARDNGVENWQYATCEYVAENELCDAHPDVAELCPCVCERMEDEPLKQDA